MSFHPPPLPHHFSPIVGTPRLLNNVLRIFESRLFPLRPLSSMNTKSLCYVYCVNKFLLFFYAKSFDSYHISILADILIHNETISVYSFLPCTASFTGSTIAFSLFATSHTPLHLSHHEFPFFNNQQLTISVVIQKSIEFVFSSLTSPPPGFFLAKIIVISFCLQNLIFIIGMKALLTCSYIPGISFRNRFLAVNFLTVPSVAIIKYV